MPDIEPVDKINTSEYEVEGEWGWYNAPIPPPGGFLVNVGLAMELWSGGAYKATLHRVVFPPPKAGQELEGRYSMTLFVQPDDEVVSFSLHPSLAQLTGQEIRPVLEGGKVDMDVLAITSKELFGGKLKESFERIKAMPARTG